MRRLDVNFLVISEIFLFFVGKITFCSGERNSSPVKTCFRPYKTASVCRGFPGLLGDLALFSIWI